MQQTSPIRSEPLDTGGFRWLCWLGAFIALSTCWGCGTTSTHTITEQLLVSDAIDEAIAKISFDDLNGQSVFLDTAYVQPVKEMGFANTNYIISSLRQQLLASGCYLQETKDKADIIVEPRVGALGTEGQVVTFGIPRSQEISTAASVFAGAPLVPQIPEIAFGKSDLQSGAARIAVFAYYRETREPVWQSGTRLAKSYSKSTWVLGAGPFRRGTIHDGWRFAGNRLGLPGLTRSTRPTFDEPDIAFESEFHYRNANGTEGDTEGGIEELPSGAVQLTGHERTLDNGSGNANSGTGAGSPADGSPANGSGGSGDNQ